MTLTTSQVIILCANFFLVGFGVAYLMLRKRT